jgi:hypothetical protein
MDVPYSVMATGLSLSLSLSPSLSLSHSLSLSLTHKHTHARDTAQRNTRHNGCRHAHPGWRAAPQQQVPLGSCCWRPNAPGSDGCCAHPPAMRSSSTTSLGAVDSSWLISPKDATPAARCICFCSSLKTEPAPAPAAAAAAVSADQLWQLGSLWRSGVPCISQPGCRTCWHA